MRPTTVAMAVALGIGLPCTVVQINGFSDWPTIWILSGIGFAIGVIVMVTVDEVFYRKDQHSFIRQRNALTDATMIATLEREARLNPTVATVESEPVTIGEEINRLQRARQFEIAHWQTYYRRIMAAGWAYGFDIRTLTDPDRETRVTSAPGWNTATGRIRDAGFIVKDNTGTRPTVSEAEWNAGRLWEKVTCPIGEPPDIVSPPYTRQQTQHQTPAKQVVIDG